MDFGGKGGGTARAALVLRGARLADGSGEPAVKGEVGLRDGIICAVGPPGSLAGDRVLALDGLVLAPGFIDAHTHDDRYLLATPDVPAKASQGVTTVVTGNCGISLAPLRLPAGRLPPAPLDLLGAAGDFAYADFAAYLARLDAEPAAVNVVPLVGHTTLRVQEVADLEREADDGEIARMRARCDEALRAGAFGVSTGVFYPPARAATLHELLEVCRPLSRHGGVFATHLRDETDGIDDALREAFAVGRALGVPVLVSHHKLAGLCNHGRSPETLAMFDAAVAARQDVSFDVYPYTASSTMLRWERVRIAERVLIAWSVPHPELAGKTFGEAAAVLGLQGAAAVEAMLPAGATYFMMDQADVDRIMSHPLAMIGSDGLPHDARPHPRLWGTFPRVLGHYVRERGLLGLEQAVRKMTALPARRFGLRDRGRIAVGCRADLVAFDPHTVLDMADFDAPERPARGIAHVFVNGCAVLRDGRPTGARPGMRLRPSGRPGAAA